MKKLLVFGFLLIKSIVSDGQSIHPNDPVVLPANLENMRTGQVLDAVTRDCMIILPVGTLESTSNDIPVGINSVELQRSLDSLSLKNNAVIAPAIWYSPTGYLVGGPGDGSFDMQTNAFVKYMEEVMTGFYMMGFKHVKIVIIHDLPGEDSPLVKACRYAIGNFFNEYWKDEEVGAGWWLNPEKDINYNKTSLEIISLKAEKQKINKGKSSSCLEEMTPSEIRKAAEAGLLCIVPVGVIECHGNHNPVGCDIIKVKEPLLLTSARIPFVIAPAINYGGTALAVSGPALGTMDMNGQTGYEYSLEVARGLIALGFRHIIFCSGHQIGGAQSAGLELIAQEVRRMVTEKNGYGWMKRLKEGEKLYPVVEYIINPATTDDHGGKCETSWMLYFRPSNTKMELLNPGDYEFCWMKDMESIRASYEQGKQMTEDIVEEWIKIIKERQVSPGK